MKKCAKCHKELPLESFGNSAKSKDGHVSYCKSCMAQYVRDWQKRNPNKRRKYQSIHYMKNSECIELKRKQRRSADPSKARILQNKHGRTHLLKKRGLTHETFLKKLEAQSSICAICSTELTEKTAVIDHCHRTGGTRDLLCSPCNLALGHIEKKEFLDKALAYIERHRSTG